MELIWYLNQCCQIPVDSRWKVFLKTAPRFLHVNGVQIFFKKVCRNFVCGTDCLGTKQQNFKNKRLFNLKTLSLRRTQLVGPYNHSRAAPFDLPFYSFTYFSTRIYFSISSACSRLGHHLLVPSEFQ